MYHLPRKRLNISKTFWVVRFNTYMMILAMCQIWCKKKYDSSTKLGFDYDKMVKEEATGFEISRIAKLLKGKTEEPK